MISIALELGQWDMCTSKHAACHLRVLLQGVRVPILYNNTAAGKCVTTARSNIDGPRPASTKCEESVDWLLQTTLYKYTPGGSLIMKCGWSWEKEGGRPGATNSCDGTGWKGKLSEGILALGKGE